MASELKSSGATSGSTYYAIIRNAAGSFYNGSTFEAYNASNWTTYDVAAATANGAGIWTGDFPALSAGVYSVELRLQSGGSPAITDTTFAGPYTFRWDGTDEVVVGSLVSNAITSTTLASSASLEIADAIWDEDASHHTSAGSTGALLNLLDDINSQTGLITSGRFTIITAVSDQGLTIRKGDSYGTTSGQTLVVDKPTGASWPSLSSGSFTVYLTAAIDPDNAAAGTSTLSKACVVVDDDTVRIDLATTDTTALALGAWTWELEASKSGIRNTLISGVMRVLPELRTT